MFDLEFAADAVPDLDHFLVLLSDYSIACWSKQNLFSVVFKVSLDTAFDIHTDFCNILVDLAFVTTNTVVDASNDLFVAYDAGIS